MAQRIDDNSERLTLDIPKREGKEGYIGTMLQLYLKMGGIIAEANFTNNDLRVEYMTHFMLSTIPSKEKRIEIRQRLRERITNEVDADKLMTNEQKNKKKNLICIEFMGETMDWIDEHLGISVENKIGFVNVRPNISPNISK